MRYFFAQPPSLLSTTLKSQLRLPQESDVVAVAEDTRVARMQKKRTQADDVDDGKDDNEKHQSVPPLQQWGGYKQRFECNNCGIALLLTPVEILKHKSSCK